MNKLLFALISALIFFSMPVTAHAAEKTADSSAVISQGEADSSRIHELAIKRVLNRYKSPLADQADTFVAVARENELDPYMLPAIAGVESGFGHAMIDATLNPFGWGGGRIYFDSWEDGIETVGKGLHKRYYGRGAKTVHDVGPIYAGGSKTWAPKVLSFMRAFEREEARIKRLSLI